MRVAAIQLTSTAHKPRNLEAAEKHVRAAVEGGAELVVLPEMFPAWGDAEVVRGAAEPLDGPTLTRMRDLARQLGVWLVAGSVAERVAASDKLYNTCCLIDQQGQIAAVYRKIHLFDCDVPGAALRESSVVLPGQELVLAEADELR